MIFILINFLLYFMDILEKKQNLDYTDDIKFLIKLFKFNDYPLILAGSSSKKIFKYFGDYDFITNITDNSQDTKKLFFDFIQNLLNIITDDTDLFFIELKMQYKNKKIKLNKNDVFEEFNIKQLDKVEYVKIDIIQYYDRRFIEVSSIYNFSERISKEELIDKIYEDYDEYLKEGNYMKALKRLYSIEEKRGNIKMAKLLISFLNSKVGEAYRDYSNLETIQLLKDNYKLSKLDKERIKLNLKDIGFYKNSISNNIQKLNDYIQTEAKFFYNKIREYIT